MPCHQFASFKGKICVNVIQDVAQFDSLRKKIIFDTHVHYNYILHLRLPSLKKEIHNEFTSTSDSHWKELDNKKIDLLFGSALSDHAETIMPTNKMDQTQNLINLVKKKTG